MASIIDWSINKVKQAAANVLGNVQAIANPQTRATWFKGFTPPLQGPVGSAIRNFQSIARPSMVKPLIQSFTPQAPQQIHQPLINLKQNFTNLTNPQTQGTFLKGFTPNINLPKPVKNLATNVSLLANPKTAPTMLQSFQPKNKIGSELYKAVVYNPKEKQLFPMGYMANVNRIDKAEKDYKTGKITAKQLREIKVAELTNPIFAMSGGLKSKKPQVKGGVEGGVKIPSVLEPLAKQARKYKSYKEYAQHLSQNPQKVRFLQESGISSPKDFYIQATKKVEGGVRGGKVKVSPDGKVKVKGVGTVNVPEMVSADTRTPVQKVLEALKGAKETRGQQEKIYTQIRGKQSGAISDIGAKIPGEAGYKAKLGALEGEMPKVSFRSIRKQVDQPTIDSLFNQVEMSALRPFEKVTAQRGLAKLLGVSGGTVPTESELKLLQPIFGDEFVQAVLSKKSLMEKLFEEGVGALTIPRTVMASFDFSAPLRQGIFALPKQMMTHPIRTLGTLGNMFKYAFNKKFYNTSMEAIKSDPLYGVAFDGRLAITDLQGGLLNSEEAFMSKLAQKIPGVGASGRAYVGFLNKLRFDMFKDMYSTATKNNLLETNPGLVESMTRFINSATGRGSWGQTLNRVSPILNATFFSPRLMKSRIDLLNPYYYMKLDPFVRKEALKNLVAFISTGVGVLSLAKMAGGDKVQVEKDPTSADVGKIKVGNTRLDPWGGFQQYVRLAAQLATGKLKSTTTGLTYDLTEEGYKTITRGDILSRFMSQKEAPVVSFLTMLMTGKNALGEKANIPAEAINRMMPMVISDMYDLYKEGGLENTFLGVPAFFGVGTQTYGQKQAQMGTTAMGNPKVEFKDRPGLGEDIAAKVMNTPPPTTLPNSQQLYQNYLQEKQKDYQLTEMKKQAVSGNMQPQGNYVPVQTEDGVKIIDLSFQPKEPEMTGNSELDKKVISEYKSDITKKTNDIYELYKANMLSAEEANAQILKLKSATNRFATPKKRAIKKVGIPSVKKAAAPKGAKIKVPKTPKLKVLKSKKYRVKKAKQPKIKVKMPKLPKFG